MRSICAVIFAVPLSLLAAFEHVDYEPFSLDGAWEMAYNPNSFESDTALPQFRGVTIEKAVPGYWEDMKDSFKSAGMTNEFRVKTDCGPRTYPILGWAPDMTLPNIFGCFYYRRHFTLSQPGDAVLSFEGARNRARVWVNGRYMAAHAGYSTSFEIPVPKDALQKGTNEIVLAVSNDPVPGWAPGKFDAGLSSRSVFDWSGGVTGRLELRLLNSRLSDVYVTTADDLASFAVHVGGGEPFEWKILDGNSVVASGNAAGDFSLSARGFSFWSPESPKLYALELVSGGRTVRRPFGIRRLVAKGEKLLLNGKPVYLRGVTEHCYFPRTVHIPRDYGYYKMVAEKRKELGFNHVRFHTFVPPKEYLDATDRIGMLVHLETPCNVSEAELKEIVAFARQHPSVVIYCMGNEMGISDKFELYLESLAGIVHSETDALFTPMSALRYVDYDLEKDAPVENKPFPHNAERMARLAKYSDLFVSVNGGHASYNSLYGCDGKKIDEMGDAFCGKPRLAHETCIHGTYVDFSLENDYPAGSPIVKTGIFAGLRKALADKGLLDRADVYYRNSCEWQRRMRKKAFEGLRAADRVVGFDFLGDINTHWHTFGYSAGMMDEFYRLKYGETVENVLRYNNDAVLLADFGYRFYVAAGERKKISFKLSNYRADAAGGVVTVDLKDGKGRVLSSGNIEVGALPSGRVHDLGSVELQIPKTAVPVVYTVCARLSGGMDVSNEWELFAFPNEAPAAPPQGVRVMSGIVSREELLSALEGGDRVLLLGAGPFKSLKTYAQIGGPGRSGGTMATVIKKGHPLFADMPNDGYLSWPFVNLMQIGNAVQIEADVPFDPVVDVASQARCPIRQAFVFEYQVGRGRLLVCSFNLSGNDVVTRWMTRRLYEYAASDAFRPAHAISAAQLAAIIDAPLVETKPNANFANNPNDPAGRSQTQPKRKE